VTYNDMWSALKVRCLPARESFVAVSAKTVLATSSSG